MVTFLGNFLYAEFWGGLSPSSGTFLATFLQILGGLEPPQPPLNGAHVIIFLVRSSWPSPRSRRCTSGILR